MTSIHDTYSYDRFERPGSRSGPRAAPRARTVLPEADRLQLQGHLDLCDGLQQPADKMLAGVLHNKIMTTEPLGTLKARDIVTGGCCVTYSIDNGPGQTGLLVHRARSGAGSGVIPVSSLLGATLIGMRVGQRGPLLCEDGTIVSLSVLNVTPPN